MSKQPRNQTRGKALDLWTAPEGAGEPLVCIATSFTFDATFFETECVGRFLQMDHHPSESESVAYLIEREEKLSAAKVCALVDRRHARDKESLRWDIIGVLVPKAIQHSKVSLLVWHNHVRVIVGSGNLTEYGYRKNLEVFGTIELSRRFGGDRAGIYNTIDFLRAVATAGVGDDVEGTPKHRVRQALSAARDRIARWSVDETTNNALPVFGVPGRGVLPQVFEHWPSGGPPRTAWVMSPFFDLPGNDVGTVTALMDGMAQRGARDIVFCIRREHIPDGRSRLYAPLAMVKKAEERCDVEVQVISATQDGERRPLHAKIICLESDNWCLMLAGSSNFTAAGLTAATGGSFEANLLYRVKMEDADKSVTQLWPDVDEDVFDSSSPNVVWDPEPEECEGGLGQVALPACFHEAIFVAGSDPTLIVQLRAGLPGIWSIKVPDGPAILSSRHAVEGKHQLSWATKPVPFVLEVSWEGDGATNVASWPVNISNPSALPPPEALQGLTLEELLAILASTRPLPQAVVAVLKKRGKAKARGDFDLDPLRRLDSPAFLLRRTKRVAAALDRLRERLERPVLTKDAFDWRLNGPVGPLALADAFNREATLPGEAQFYLAELALTLKRVVPQRPAEGGLGVVTVQEMLAAAIANLRSRANGTSQVPTAPQIAEYVGAAFKEAAAV